MIANGKQRRAFLKFQGVLKNKRKQSFKKWAAEVASNIEAGREMHQTNVDETQKNIELQLEEIEKNLVESWERMGYDKEEINLLIEANALLLVKDKETLREDRKEARRLMKNARARKNKRLNG